MSLTIDSESDLQFTEVEWDAPKSSTPKYQKVTPLTKDKASAAVEVDFRVQEATKGVFKAIGDFFGSVFNGSSLTGKIGRALLFGAAAGIVAAIFLSNPIGWIVFGSVVTVTLIAQLAIPTYLDARENNVGFGQMAAFKLSAWRRSFSDKNYDHVFTAPNGAKLFLGALPNHNSFDLSKLVLDENIGAVISINEKWERNEIGVSHPYTKEEYEDAGLHYRAFDAYDHQLLDRDTLIAIACAIDEELSAGRNVYIHCRAGVGRSAMGVAAYLMMWQDQTADEAAKQIKHGGGEGEFFAPGRKKSTIMKKLDDKVDKHDEVVQQGLRSFQPFDKFIGQD